MSASVILTVIQGPHKEQEYAFNERTSCLIGRAEDCQIRLPNDAAHRVISRHHCLLEVHPPAALILICDFRSLNGTFVNGQLIGKRDTKSLEEEGTQQAFPQHELKDGDEIQLARTHTVFRVQVARAQDPAEYLPLASPVLSTVFPIASSSPEFLLATRGVLDEWASVWPLPPTNASLRSIWQEAEDVFLGLLEKGQKANAAPEWAMLREWRYVRLLGVGGMGAVALVQRPRDGQRIALKVLRPRLEVPLRDAELFRREVENTKALTHPNIVRFWFSQCVEAPFFFALEFCPGGSLGAYVQRRGGTLPTLEAVRLILQALDGLGYAHQAVVPYSQLEAGASGSARGLVHRDLKPDNLFLTGPVSAPLVKIGDFGLAKAFDLAGYSGFTQSDLAAGSAGFMPRQQARNFKYLRPDADVWATAATLYHLLTGKTPRNFTPGTHPLLVVLEEPIVPVRQRNPEIPKPLAELLDEALIEQPDITLETAVEFKQRLLAVCHAVGWRP